MVILRLLTSDVSFEMMFQCAIGTSLGIEMNSMMPYILICHHFGIEKL